jgi:hypothetical protein
VVALPRAPPDLLIRRSHTDVPDPFKSVRGLRLGPPVVQAVRTLRRLLAGRGTGRFAARLVLGAVHGILPRQAVLLDTLGR